MSEPESGPSGDMAASQARLAAILEEISQRSLPPVHAWQPERSGEIDIRIARDGRWYYRGSPIHRERMVRLFASVLRRDDDGIWLVTPVEKLRIEVEDAPFVAVSVERHGAPDAQTLVFRTGLGDSVVADAEHPIDVRYATPDAEPRPYVRVRDRLDALIERQVFIDLARFAEVRGDVAGVVSRGVFMPLGPAD